MCDSCKDRWKRGNLRLFIKVFQNNVFLIKQLSVEDITYQQRAVFDIMLMETDRYADVKKVTKDPEYRDKLMKEYKLVG